MGGGLGGVGEGDGGWGKGVGESELSPAAGPLFLFLFLFLVSEGFPTPKRAVPKEPSGVRFPTHKPPKKARFQLAFPKADKPIATFRPLGEPEAMKFRESRRLQRTQRVLRGSGKNEAPSPYLKPYKIPSWPKHCPVTSFVRLKRVPLMCVFLQIRSWRFEGASHQTPIRIFGA